MNISDKGLEKSGTLSDKLNTTYVLSIWKDNAIDMYEVSNSILDGIVEDLIDCGMENTINRTDKFVSILNNDVNTVYYTNGEDREKKIKEILNVVR